MDKITYSQIRIRLAKIVKNIFTKRFNDIYTSNIEQFSEEQLIERNRVLSNEVREFAHEIYENRYVTHKLNSLYSSVSPEIICCFYYRLQILGCN